MMIPTFLINFFSVILFLNSVLVACATSIGSKSIHRRVITLLIFLSAFLTYFILKCDYSNGMQDNLWYSLMARVLLEDQYQYKQDVLGASVISAVPFTILSLISKYPFPLDAAFSSFFLGYIFVSSHDKSTIFSHFQSLVITYLVMPMVSACFTWLMYRILIRGIMYAEEEEMFKVTLSWCGFIYPTAIAALVTACAFINYLYNASFASKIIIGLLILTISYALSYVLFKVFLKAWLKRHAFLMYPQEYAVYMERSEKVEQGDREARGLGPIQNYYLPKLSSASSSSQRDSGSIHMQQTITTVSPAVIAGKLAIIAKRSEELFRPVTNLMTVVLLFMVSSFESYNLMNIIKTAVGELAVTPAYLMWPSLISIMIGGVFFSHRSGMLIGRNIIHEMRFSQAFAIQLGTLLTLTLVLFLHSIPPAPMWYLFSSVAAVSTSLSNNQTVVDDNGTDNEGDEIKTFRYKLAQIMFFWSSAIVFGFSSGALVCYLYKTNQ